MTLLTGRSRYGICGVVLASITLVACDRADWGADLPGAAFETRPPGEAAEIDEIVKLTPILQEIRAQKVESQEGKLLRGVHPKAHGCVKAEFAIRDDIEAQYRVGLFAHPGEAHEAWIRFSNAAVLRQDDLKANRRGIRTNGSRGMAIKVVGVEGEMLSLDGGQGNQDFLMINTPEFAFANVHDYLRLNEILARSEDGSDPFLYFVPAVLERLGPPVDGERTEVTVTRQFLQVALDGEPLINSLSEDEFLGTKASARVAATISGQTVRNPMQVQYFGAAPFLFGAGRAMKFSAAPCVATEQAEFAEITADNPSTDYLTEALRRTMNGAHDVCYDFKIQVRGLDAEGLNIEDATTTWPPDEVASYVNVARITIAVPQTPQAPAAVAQCEALAFNPWHSLVDHQPLGGINRLRREVYSNSAEHRGADGY